MKTKAVKSPKDSADKSRRMPAMFVGHGSPLNAIEDNEFSRHWRQIGKSLPKPKAILCISAHWETWGTADYRSLGDAVQMSVPTPEHFLPLLYVLAVQQKGEKIVYFNDKPLAGSLTMTSLIIG